jgi:hypothetical protein
MVSTLVCLLLVRTDPNTPDPSQLVISKRKFGADTLSDLWRHAFIHPVFAWRDVHHEVSTGAVANGSRSKLVPAEESLVSLRLKTQRSRQTPIEYCEW